MRYVQPEAPSDWQRPSYAIGQTVPLVRAVSSRKWRRGIVEKGATSREGGQVPARAGSEDNRRNRPASPLTGEEYLHAFEETLRRLAR